MNGGAAVRPLLEAADARDLLRAWLDQLAAALEDPNHSPESAFGLLALRGRLRRADPFVLETLDPDRSRDRLDALLAGDEAVWARRAISQIDRSAWRAAVEELDRFQDESGPAEEVRRRAARLLLELDDAELLWHAARRLGVAPSALRDDLDADVRLLVTHGTTFLAVAPFVRLLARTLRRDLEAFDPPLAVTGRKFGHLLELFDDAEHDMRPLPAEAGLLPEGLAAPPSRPPPGRIPARLDYSLAAGPEEVLPAVVGYRWRSADGKRSARLDVPRAAPAGCRLFLEFDDPELNGQPVLLGGLRATIDDGLAAFAWDEVRAVEPFLDVLLVGAQRPWRLLG